jgi:hypothetical protein
MFLAWEIKFNVAYSPYYEKIIHAIYDSLVNTRHLTMRIFPQSLLTRRNIHLEKNMAPFRVSWSIDGLTYAQMFPHLNAIVFSALGHSFLATNKVQDILEGSMIYYFLVMHPVIQQLKYPMLETSYK